MSEKAILQKIDDILTKHSDKLLHILLHILFIAILSLIGILFDAAMNYSLSSSLGMVLTSVIILIPATLIDIEIADKIPWHKIPLRIVKPKKKSS